MGRADLLGNVPRIHLVDQLWARLSTTGLTSEAVFSDVPNLNPFDVLPEPEGSGEAKVTYQLAEAAVE